MSAVTCDTGSIQLTTRVGDAVFAIVLDVFAYKKMLGRIETRTRDRIYCQTLRTVRDISRDVRARIATCSLRTLTDRLKENYSIDICKCWRRCDLNKHKLTESRVGYPWGQSTTLELCSACIFSSTTAVIGDNEIDSKTNP